MQKIIACIDGSAMAQSVCDAAIWASRKLEKTVLFLHTIEKEQQHGADDLSGAIGLGASAALLEEMACRAGLAAWQKHAVGSGGTRGRVRRVGGGTKAASR